MTSVNHVGLAVADLERSRRFYEGALGFTLVREMEVPDGAAAPLLQVEPPVGLRVAYLAHGDFTLELLHLAGPDLPPPRPRPFTEVGLTHLSLTVDDVAAACERVTEHGGEVLADTEVAGLAVMVRDPDGQLLELLAPGALPS